MTGQFYGCYLLVSENASRHLRGRCYVGFTVDPSRRINQHNRGHEFGGAKKTNDRGPWQMVLVVHGFPNELCALRFEWAWQHPAIARCLSKFAGKKQAKESSFQFHVRVANHMLSVGPWNRLSLTVQWLNEDYRLSAHHLLQLASHMKIVYGFLDSITSTTNAKNDVTSISDFCSLCNLRVDGSAFSCPSTSCSALFHVICLGKEANKAQPEFIMPIHCTCPSCSERFLWGQWVTTKMTLRSEMSVCEVDNV